MDDAGPARSYENLEPYSYVVLGGFQPFYFSGNEKVDFIVPRCVFPRGSSFRLTGCNCIVFGETNVKRFQTNSGQRIKNL